MSGDTTADTYVPQLTDDVVLTLRLPATTEEWADELLAEEFEVHRDYDGSLLVAQKVGGNTNALSVARYFVEQVEDYLREGEVDPMTFELTAVAQPRKDKW